MTLNSFSIFLTVVEEMNFTRAAHRLFITQQSLSGHIRRLEEEYGVTLFERKPVLKLTPEGKNMVFYARQILQAENAMVSGFADITKNSAAYLNIGISYMRSGVFGSGIWRRFHKRYPNIEVRFSEKNTDRLLEDLQRGDLNMMIGIDVRAVSGLKVVPLVDEQLRCIIKRSLLEEHYGEAAKDMEQKFLAGGIHLEEIRDIPMLFPPKGNRLRIPLEQVFRQAGVMPRIIFESDLPELLYRLGIEGDGAAIITPMTIYDHFRQGTWFPEDCCNFHVLETGTSRIALAYQADIQMPKYVEGMIEAVQEEFGEYRMLIERNNI
ncbi:MAG: LysR family transcriptional regulator [Eubacteriales bacterium]|nr:LysR family transcriptional regulator [Eubacteriales bacterium]